MAAWCEEGDHGGNGAPALVTNTSSAAETTRSLTLGEVGMNSTSSDLGEIRETFRPQLANICAGAILGLALLVGGTSAALYFALRDDPKPLRDTGDYIAKYVII